MGNNPFRVVTIDVEGNVAECDWDAPDTEARVKLLSAAVGDGLFDVVGLSQNLDMWVNDEGVYLFPVNVVATGVARRFGFTHQPYFGPVVFTGGADQEGETLPLSDLMRRAVVAHALQVKGMGSLGAR